VPTAGSGAPVLDLPGVGGRATLEAGALEVLPPEPDGCDAP
jgi:hypothetical protein